MANSREEDAGAGEPPGSSGTNSMPGSFAEKPPQAEMPAAAQRRKERENRRPAGQRSFFAQNQEQRRFLTEKPERCRLCRAGSRQNRAETAGAAEAHTESQPPAFEMKTTLPEGSSGRKSLSWAQLYRMAQSSAT